LTEQYGRKQVLHCALDREGFPIVRQVDLIIVPHSKAQRAAAFLRRSINGGSFPKTPLDRRPRWIELEVEPAGREERLFNHEPHPFIPKDHGELDIAGGAGLVQLYR
jgi:hypothetical protein